LINVFAAHPCGRQSCFARHAYSIANSAGLRPLTTATVPGTDMRSRTGNPNCDRQADQHQTTARHRGTVLLATSRTGKWIHGGNSLPGGRNRSSDHPFERRSKGGADREQTHTQKRLHSTIRSREPEPSGDDGGATELYGLFACWRSWRCLRGRLLGPSRQRGPAFYALRSQQAIRTSTTSVGTMNKIIRT